VGSSFFGSSFLSAFLSSALPSFGVFRLTFSMGCGAPNSGDTTSSTVSLSGAYEDGSFPCKAFAREGGQHLWRWLVLLPSVLHSEEDDGEDDDRHDQDENHEDDTDVVEFP